MHEKQTKKTNCTKIFESTKRQWMLFLDALGDAELLTKVILDHVTDETPIGRRPAKNAIHKRTGEDYDQGHRWTVGVAIRTRNITKSWPTRWVVSSR